MPGDEKGEVAIAKAVSHTELNPDFGGNADSFEGGVLFTMGTALGKGRTATRSAAEWSTSPHRMRKLRLTTTGHRQGETRMAGELISQIHPGANATMWSRELLGHGLVST